jgi:hypothetical protein
MPSTNRKMSNDHLGERDYVLLFFDKQDAQIVRSWQKSKDGKDIFDGKN